MLITLPPGLDKLYVDPPHNTDPAIEAIQEACELRRKAFVVNWARSGGNVVYAPEKNINEPGIPPWYAEWSDRPSGPIEYGKAFPIPGHKSSDAVIVRHPGDDPAFYDALWVRKDYSQNKVRAALSTFLAQTHGVSFPDGVTLARAGYDADHLWNQARTPEGTFMRVEPSLSSIQRHWGRLYERAASNKQFENQKIMGTPTWFTWAKVVGLTPPEGWADNDWLTDMGHIAAMIAENDQLAVRLQKNELFRAYMHQKKDRDHHRDERAAFDEQDLEDL